jgi:4,4'-diaponeurosporenoate glycosyltransferase
VPSCPAAPGRGIPTGTVSIVIPARNEEHNLERLLASVAGLLDRPREVIVVDDASTDRTVEVARGFGARVLAAPPLPPGWSGKSWACWNGAAVAGGRSLLFLDADTTLAPDALARMQAARSETACRVLSVVPYHRVVRPYEQLSATFNLMTCIGTGAFSLLRSPGRPTGMFGPVLLIDRADYEAVGGHRAVRAEILENMSMAPLLHGHGIPVCCRGGRGVVQTRMYPDGVSTLVEGWSKAFAAGAAKTAPLTLLLAVAWLSGGMAAVLLAVCSLFVPALPSILWLAYGAYSASLVVMLRQLGSFSLWTSVLYPAPFVAFLLIFARSFFLRQGRGRVTWKGRSVDASHEGTATG